MNTGAYLYSFLTSKLDWGAWWRPSAGRFTLRQTAPPILQEVVWAPRSGLDVCQEDKISCMHRISNPGLPGHREPLYRTHDPTPSLTVRHITLALFVANPGTSSTETVQKREPTDSNEIIFRTKNELKENSVQINECSSIKLCFYQSDLRFICSYSVIFNC